MKVLSEKGDCSEGFSNLMSDKTKIKSEGKLLYQLIIEILLTKFGTNQMEHVQRGVDKIKSAILPMFAENQEAQIVLIETIFKSFNMDQLAAQDFTKENLFQLRQKVSNLILRFLSIGLLKTQNIINWCLEQLETFTSSPVSLQFTHCYLILQLIQRLQSQRGHIVDKFVQELDKATEVKVETDYEKRVREEAEAKGEEVRPGFEKPKEKTPEEIKAAQTQIEADYRQLYKHTFDEEKAVINTTLTRLSNQAHLRLLMDKIVLSSTHFKLSSTKVSDLQVQNDLIQAILK